MLSPTQEIEAPDAGDPDRKDAFTLLARLATDAGAQSDANGRLFIGSADITDLSAFLVGWPLQRAFA